MIGTFRKRFSHAKGQTMVEFTLVLPVLLLLTFGIIEFGRLVHAWLAIENGARFGARYAVTGQFDVDYCADAATALGLEAKDGFGGDPIDCNVPKAADPDYVNLTSQLVDWARIPSIQDNARVGAAGIFYTESASFDQPGYLKTVVCSSPKNYSDIDRGADPVQPPQCNDEDFAGTPGNVVKIAVFFNHRMLTPFISSVWPHLPLMATREMIVETYKNPRVFGGPAAVDTATPASTNTPTYTSTSTFTPSATSTASPSATVTPTPTPDPCNDISFSTDWTLTSREAKISVTNNSGVDRKLDRAVFDWGNYDVYTPTQSMKELKWGADKIFDGADPDSTTDTGGGLNKDSKKGETIEFLAKFQEEDDDLSGFFEPGDFGATLYFTNGCTLIKPATIVRATPTATATHVSGPEGEIWFIGDDPDVWAHVEWSTNPDGSVKTKTTFSFDFVDNTYGENASGWEDSKNGTHTFRELWHSDHVRLNFYNGNGELFFDAKVDYLYESGDGWESGGVTDGDGQVFVGDAGMVTSFRTSMSENINTLGCELYEDSPSVENPVECPDWDFSMWYEVTLSPDAFAEFGFAYPDLTFVHASPAKTEDSTVEVEPGPSPVPTSIGTPSATPTPPTPTVTNTPTITPVPPATNTPTETTTPLPTEEICFDC